ncbi:hypothetical protein LZ31DRAFT_68022 [Colletotrichum somersetense]|nr:hypothetical protein LZ31DRAFT_68022 [Colletotrichum somersetense]
MHEPAPARLFQPASCRKLERRERNGKLLKDSPPVPPPNYPIARRVPVSPSRRILFLFYFENPFCRIFHPSLALVTAAIANNAPSQVFPPSPVDKS